MLKTRRILPFFFLLSIIAYGVSEMPFAWGQEDDELLKAPQTPGASINDGKTYQLTSVRKAGLVDKVEMTLEAVGDVTQFLEGQPQPQSSKMQILAAFRYEERPEKYASEPDSHLQSLRYYDIARAEIQVGDATNKPSLDANRKQIVCDVRDNNVSLFSPTGTLKDDQLLLIEDLPANTLLLDRLLPKETVKIGDTWELPDEVLRPLLALDAVETQDLVAVLSSVENNVALVEINGDVQGGHLGAGCAMNVRLMYQFDLTSQRIIWLGLVITESRSLGNVGPAVDLIAKVIMKVQPDIEAIYLKKDRKFAIPEEIEEHLALTYNSPDRGPWKFLHGRDWYVIFDEPGSTKMRLLTSGELISQCDIVKMPKADITAPTSLTAFQRDLKNELKDNFGKFLSATEGKTKKGYRELRVVISSKSEEMPLVWIYYLLTKSDGHQAIMAFVVREDMLEKFNDADHAIVDSFEMYSTLR